ncbi:demethoxyubiquinone hydroxylase family protein [Kordiimonas marina]|uniref:demethoxyubiquinone hydroxylase family protein n=1 Tax=Kordiimonas marina TaxID=2872312 RepID=UPI001FF5C116|nr:demethoxyubiquinone hydroxylase family protein [Kordiimonas marina]MCJ9428428.1 demethoxyubiquinone hydroxylase family protein [Kordiimonas marina]
MAKAAAKAETDIYPAVTEKTAPARPLPGDRDVTVLTERMVRVDHAGEFGAVRIYSGQRAVLGERHPMAGMLRHMHAQEEVHLDRFNKLMNKRGVRPTALSPFWDVAGFALGAATALMGEKAAMACTAAVEEVIDEHYQSQLDTLDGADPELEGMIKTFQAEEVEHKEIALENGAEDTPGYPILSGAIKAGCRAAIWLAKRV